MTPKQLSYGILRALGIAVLICLLLYFLWLIRSVFAYLAIAFVLAMIGRPLMNLMHNRLKIPNALASIITITLFLFLVIGFAGLFISLVFSVSYRFCANFCHLYGFEDPVTGQLNLLSDSLGLLDMPFLKNYWDDAVRQVNVKSFSGMFGSSITTLGKIMIDAFSVVFITFFFLRDRDLINKMFVTIAPNGEEARFEWVLDKTKDLLSRYFIGLTLQVLI